VLVAGGFAWPFHEWAEQGGDKEAPEIKKRLCFILFFVHVDEPEFNGYFILSFQYRFEGCWGFVSGPASRLAPDNSLHLWQKENPCCHPT